MKKIIIMSVALTTTLLAGETMMAAVFGFVMVTGYLAGYFLSQPGRRAIECRVLAIRGDSRGPRISSRKGSSESMLDRAGGDQMKKRIYMYTRILVVLVLGSAFWPVGASAECTWEWLCDASGEDCSRGAVCDSVDDVMPPAPPDTRPVVAPSMEPSGAVGAPPAGTSDCKQVRRCDSEGSCIWDTLCLCL